MSSCGNIAMAWINPAQAQAPGPKVAVRQGRNKRNERCFPLWQPRPRRWGPPSADRREPGPCPAPIRAVTLHPETRGKNSRRNREDSGSLRHSQPAPYLRAGKSRVAHELHCPPAGTSPERQRSPCDCREDAVGHGPRKTRRARTRRRIPHRRRRQTPPGPVTRDRYRLQPPGREGDGNR